MVEQSLLGWRRIVVQPVVQLPEMALSGRGLRGAGDEGRPRVGAFVGKVPVDIDEPVAEDLAQLADNGPQPAAKRAEIVAIENKADGVLHLRAAAQVIALPVDGPLQPES